MDDSLQEILLPVATVLIVCIWYFFLKDKMKGKGNTNDVIKNDPVLNKLDKEIGDINKEAGIELYKDRKLVARMKASGAVSSDCDKDFRFDKTEFLNDFKKMLFSRAAQQEIFHNYSDDIIDRIDERLKFEKRITKTNYSKFVKICEKVDFIFEQQEDWDNFEDEDEMKELQVKKEENLNKENEIRNEIYDFISKSVDNK